MKVIRTRTFTKMYLKLNRKIQNKTDETILLFADNPFNERLKNHKLH